MLSSACLALALTWAPSSPTAGRERVCGAILATTADDRLQRWLLIIATEESGFRADVLSCRTRGDHGKALSAWQVHPRTPAERKALCGDLASAAAIALSRIVESEARCARLPERWRHANYAGGNCQSRGGRRVSARRHARITDSIESEES